jgi:hypothetical protein
MATLIQSYSALNYLRCVFFGRCLLGLPAILAPKFNASIGTNDDRRINNPGVCAQDVWQFDSALSIK